MREFFVTDDYQDDPTGGLAIAWFDRLTPYERAQVIEDAFIARGATNVNEMAQAVYEMHTGQGVQPHLLNLKQLILCIRRVFKKPNGHIRIQVFDNGTGDLIHIDPGTGGSTLARFMNVTDLLRSIRHHYHLSQIDDAIALVQPSIDNWPPATPDEGTDEGDTDDD